MSPLGLNRIYQNRVTILALLFNKEEAQLMERELAMVDKNTALGGSPDGFRHMGKIYSRLTGRARQMAQLRMPHPSLVHELTSLHAEQKILESDKDKIGQALALVLKGTQTYQDMRDALPNCLRDILPELKQLDRSRPEAYTLADNPRSYNQYNKLKDKIDYYAAARLLY